VGIFQASGRFLCEHVRFHGTCVHDTISEMHAQRTHCNRGHERISANIRQDRSGLIHCIVCEKLWIDANPDRIQDHERKRQRKRKAQYIPRIRAVRTHCRRGHEYTPDNVYINSQGDRTCRACVTLWKDNNRPQIRATDQRKYAKHRVKIRARERSRRQANLFEARAKERHYDKVRRGKADPQRILRQRLSASLRNHIRAGRMNNKADHTFELIGCTARELVRHIERQFVKGMTWKNRARWHIDHIRPCASFDLNDPAQQRTCFHFTNLRPLWREKNLAKGAQLLFLI
jgi:hypothetical protein